MSGRPKRNGLANAGPFLHCLSKTFARGSQDLRKSSQDFRKSKQALLLAKHLQRLAKHLPNTCEILACPCSTHALLRLNYLLRGAHWRGFTRSMHRPNETLLQNSLNPSSRIRACPKFMYFCRPFERLKQENALSR